MLTWNKLNNYILQNKNFKKVNKFLRDCSWPWVVKDEGLGAGKGVIIGKTKKKAIKTASEIFRGKCK